MSVGLDDGRDDDFGPLVGDSRPLDAGRLLDAGRAVLDQVKALRGRRVK